MTAKIPTQTMQNYMIGLGAISSVASGIAQWRQGAAEQNAYEYNAQLALRRMKEEGIASEERFSRLMGRQRLLYGKAGVDISSGSPLLVYMDTANKGAEEAERIMRGGETEADINRFYGRTAAYRGKWGGVSTFLTGLGSASMDYLKLKNGVS